MVHFKLKFQVGQGLPAMVKLALTLPSSRPGAATSPQFAFTTFIAQLKALQQFRLR